jgi:hypothetical protein
MSRIIQFFCTPLYWQQFEDLTESLFRDVFADPLPTKNGRPGQAQHGVDVYGSRYNTGDLVGIQCKRKNDLDENGHPYPGGRITRKILREEYDKACSFQPELKLWILATTAGRDARAQEHARLLDAESRSAGRFSVKLWFWDDYITYLNNLDQLAIHYYSSVLNYRTPLDQDKKILEVFRMALSRPAFDTPFQGEKAEHFEDALRDSMTALDIGELVNRETRHVIAKAIGGWRSISNPGWREAGRVVSGKLKELRWMIQDGIKNGVIVKVGKCGMGVRNPSTEQELLRLRRECIVELNAVLTDAGMTAI